MLTMKNLYILQGKINTKEIEDETVDYIAFDYIAHNFLLTKKIPHSVIDDHIDDDERENATTKDRNNAPYNK